MLLKQRFGEHDNIDSALEIELLGSDTTTYEKQANDSMSSGIKHGIVCGNMAHQVLKLRIDLDISRVIHVSGIARRDHHPIETSENTL